MAKINELKPREAKFRDLVDEVIADRLLTKLEQDRLRAELGEFHSAYSLFSRVFRRSRRFEGSRQAMLDWLATERGLPNLARWLELGYNVKTWHVTRNGERLQKMVSLNAKGDIFEATIAKAEGRDPIPDPAEEAARKAEEQQRKNAAVQAEKAKAEQRIANLAFSAASSIQKLNDFVPETAPAGRILAVDPEDGRLLSATGLYEALATEKPVLLHKQIAPKVEGIGVVLKEARDALQVAVRVEDLRGPFATQGPAVSVSSFEAFMKWWDLEGHSFYQTHFRNEKGAQAS